MKVLFQTRQKASWIGGDLIQLEQTAEALRRLGVEVDISEEIFITPPEKLLEYDIVHLWNFSMIWTKYQLWSARKFKRPVVCSMIYHEGEDFIPFNLQQIMLDETSWAIFQTEGEKARVTRHLKLDESKSAIIPNAIDEWWLEKSDSILPLEAFVLTVGRVETNKGQLECALACKKLKIPYICIGEIREEEYAKKVKKAGGILKGKMTKRELKPYYASAKVVVQPSRAETWCLCIDEALSQGTQVVLTENCERNDIDIPRCKHGNKDDIMRAIQENWKPKDYSRSKLLKTWDEVAKDILKLYEQINL